MTLKQIAFGVSCVLVLAAAPAHAQTTQISTEYLMTLYAPLEAPQRIDDTLSIYPASPDREGWVKGPRISGKVLSPSADWIRAMPGGSSRLDVRATIKTDDGALIYLTYSGVVSHTKESAERRARGEVLTSKDYYFITAPTMQTSADKYAWLNRVQCVGKMVEVKAGDGAFVKYDIYIVR